MKVQTIAALGDIHCASKYGLHFENINVGVKYLRECYANLLKRWPKKIDLLILMGDLIDGPQRKSEGTGVTSTSLGDQTDIAIEVLRPLMRRCARAIRVDGTPYHEGFHRALAALDKEFGIQNAQQVFDLEINGKRFNIAHHPAGGGAIYMGTTVDREGLWSMIAAHEGHVPDSQWIVRAHRHCSFYQQTHMRTMLQTPCFELATPHAVKTNYFRFQPSLGGVLLQADDRFQNGFAYLPTIYQNPRKEILAYEQIKTCAPRSAD